MFGLFKKKKKVFQAKIASTGQVFTVPAGMNLLQAALNEGIEWPHDCRVGSCGTCRCTLKEGEIKELNDFSYVLDEQQMDGGMILGCQASLESDIVVEVDFKQGALKS